jgi:hypothetical protein
VSEGGNKRWEIMSRYERAWRVKHAVRFPLFLPLGTTILKPNLHRSQNEGKQHKKRKERIGEKVSK